MPLLTVKKQTIQMVDVEEVFTTHADEVINWSFFMACF